jgi:hypothetical protein
MMRRESLFDDARHDAVALELAGGKEPSGAASDDQDGRH